MPLVHHLEPNRVLTLAATDAAGAVRELAQAVAADVGLRDVDAAVERVMAREQDVSTHICPGVALPHARIAGLERGLLAVGISQDGIAWSENDDPVHVVVLLLGNDHDPIEHLSILGELARVLQREGLLAALLDSRSSDERYELLVRAQTGTDLSQNAERTQANATTLSGALYLACELKAAAVLIYADEDLDLNFVDPDSAPVRLLLASNHLRRHASYVDRFDGTIALPFSGLRDEHLLEFGMMLALSDRLLSGDDLIVCAWGRHSSGCLDSISAITLGDRFQRLLSVESDLISGDVSHHVLNRVLNIASSLAREGRESKRVGALFVLGNDEAVRPYCRQLVINPFKGYDEDQRNVLDPSLEETVKEFALIDGAFAIRGDGVILSAGSHIAIPIQDLDLPSGLGARHATAAGITLETGALAVAVSESTGNVSLYAHGKAILVLATEPR